MDAGGSDPFWRGDYKWTLRTSRTLAGYDVAWFEEPLGPDSLEDYVALRKAAPVPIAGGEVLTRRQSFWSWIKARALDNGVRFIPHGWNTAVGLAADLQLASAFPGADLVEYMTGSAYIDELAVGGWELDAESMLPIPDTLGLGLQLSADAISKYSTNGQATAE